MTSISLLSASPGFISTPRKKSLATKNRIACERFDTVTRGLGKKKLPGIALMEIDQRLR